MKVEIDLDQYFEGSFAGQVIKAATSEALVMCSKGVREAVTSAVDAQIKETIREEVTRIIGERINKPIKRTNRWGESSGKKQTFAEAVMEEFETKMSNNDHSYDDCPSIEKIIKKYAVKGLEQAVVDEFKKLNEQAQAKIKDVVSDAVTKNLMKLAK